MLYEANIPPLLRFFHIKNISPSGWIAIPNKKVIEKKGNLKNVNCDYEFVTNIKGFTNADLVWVQEEHMNYGPWGYVYPRINNV